jgi:hypothetical protein
MRKSKVQHFALVQHTAYTRNSDLRFSEAVEVGAVCLDEDQLRTLRDRKVFVTKSYKECDEEAVKENYPDPKSISWYPKALGNFTRIKGFGDTMFYIPPNSHTEDRPNPIAIFYADGKLLFSDKDSEGKPLSLATYDDYMRCDRTKINICEDFSPNDIIQLEEGLFILDDEVFPITFCQIS